MMKKEKKTLKEVPLLCLEDLLYDPKLKDDIKRDIELFYEIDFKFRNLSS